MTRSPLSAPELPLRTARLLLRRLDDGDVDAVLRYCGDDDVTRFLPFGTLDRAAVRARIERVNTDAGLGPGEHLDRDWVLGLAVEHRGTLVGDVMLRLKAGATRSVAELGYVFDPAHSGHGYATEAARALVDLAFGHFGCHRVFANLDPRNVASARVCERLGMTHEAHLRRDWWGKGEWSDSAIYGLLDTDPLPPRRPVP